MLSPSPSAAWKYARTALISSSAAAVMSLSAFGITHAQTAVPPVNLTYNECVAVTGLATLNYKAAGGRQALSPKYVGSLDYFITQDRKTFNCTGKPLINAAMCQTTEKVASAPQFIQPVSIEKKKASGPTYFISDDKKPVICNPGSEDSANVPSANFPIVIISGTKDLSMWGELEDAAYRNGINLARAVRLVPDQDGDPKIPTLLAKRLQLLISRDKISDARPIPAPR